MNWAVFHIRNSSRVGICGDNGIIYNYIFVNVDNRNQLVTTRAMKVVTDHFQNDSDAKDKLYNGFYISIGSTPKGAWDSRGHQNYISLSYAKIKSCIDTITLKEHEVSTVIKSNSDGMNCSFCKEHYPYAEANQPDGTLKCYSCRI